MTFADCTYHVPEKKSDSELCYAFKRYTCIKSLPAFLFQENESLLLVLVYDSVFGRGIPRNCKYHELLAEHTDDLVRALEEVSVECPDLVKDKKQSKALIM